VILFSLDALSDIERLRTFLGKKNPEAGMRALTVIWATIEKLEQFPDLGTPTGDPDIRQIIIHFGSSGYIVRYTSLPDRGDILITRSGHGCKSRS
jgi:plasmid stabilization system protein ParE